VPGIILINRVAKKRGITIERNEYQKSGDTFNYRIEEPNEVPLSESIDKFTLQVCMVSGVYLLTIGIIIGLEMLFRVSGVKFLIDLVPTIWGFAFMLAALVALITKMVLRRLVKTGVMHRKYPNNYMLNRIAGAAFDISIAAALILISVTTLGTLWIPVLLVTTLGGFVCIFYLRFMCNYIFKDYKDEAFLAFYGMETGTIANGMILLREIDSNFQTPAGDDLVIGSAAAIIMGFPLLLLIAQAPRPGNLWWATLVIALYLLLLIVYLFKDTIFNKRKMKKEK
jgi:ESS family glutamate:Na+ symporter